jgi:hypothetical protein
MLVWLEQQPDAIWALRYTPAGGWASLVRLDRGFEEYTVSAPDVAMDDRGRAIATWRRSSEGGSVVAARFTPEAGWSASERLDEPSSGWGYETQIAMNARGEAIAVWKGDDNTSRRVFANRFTPEAGWGTSGRIDNASDTFIEAPLRVAIDSRGTGIVVWHQESGGDPWISRITANWYVPGAGWEGAAPIEGGDASYSYLPDVAMTPDGVAFVVWLRSGEEGGIFAMRHMPDDGWGEEATVFEYPFTGTDTVPRVAASAAGEALAVWRAFDSEDAVWSSHFAPSIGWDAAAKLNNPFGSSTEAQVGMDAEGDGIAVWSQSPASGSFCYASHYVADASSKAPRANYPNGVLTAWN